MKFLAQYFYDNSDTTSYLEIVFFTDDRNFFFLYKFLQLVTLFVC